MSLHQEGGFTWREFGEFAIAPATFHIRCRNLRSWFAPLPVVRLPFPCTGKRTFSYGRGWDKAALLEPPLNDRFQMEPAIREAPDIGQAETRAGRFKTVNLSSRERRYPISERPDRRCLMVRFVLGIRFAFD